MRVILLSILLAATLLAQFDTEGAQVISYFPQLADGGPASQQWVTSFTFANPHFSLPLYGTVFLHNDAGEELLLDFGDGPVSTFDFIVPPQGTATFTSTGASPATVIGWAEAVSSLPAQAVVQFRTLVNGVPQQGVSALSTSATGLFQSQATATTGVAVVNPYPAKLRVYTNAIDSDGNVLAHTTFFLPARGHQAFNLNQKFPDLPADFRGTVGVSADIDWTVVAWALSTDGGVLSSYPPGAAVWPPSYFERIWKAWSKLVSAVPSLVAASGSFRLGNEPDLSIDTATNSINAYADTGHNVVHLVRNMAELASDSESELAFVLGHAVGHIIQFQAGKQLFNSANAERDADVISLELLMLAGYDPYASGGALGKLFMASGSAKLLDSNFDNLAIHGINPQTSFQDRLGAVYSEIQGICSLSQIQEFCSIFKSIEHPEFPPTAPFRTKPPIKATRKTWHTQ
jgi:hypothetical protein